MKLLLWNTEWARPESPVGIYIQQFAASQEAEVICYTEVCLGLHPQSGHLIESSSDYGYKNTEGRRKVGLWSTEPWQQVDTIGCETLPGGRFVSGISRGIRFVGVCIPWRDAHVKTGRKDRKAWEDHLVYLNGLKKIISRYIKEDYPVCILGDYNQRLPRSNQPEIVFDHLADLLKSDFRTVTSGILDPEKKPLIDHVSVSAGLKARIEEIHPKITKEGLRLSDHVGIVCTLTNPKQVTSSETVQSRIFQCYANLAMAHSAVSDSASAYTKKHFMIRSRLAKGLRTGTMKIGSLFDDEKEKMSHQTCCFCASTQKLSVDHLLARKHGGSDSGDNLILACQPCNSSKNKKDMLDWHLDRNRFPPLSVLRRYLKILYQYCEGNSLLDLKLDAPEISKIPFSIISLPIKFPAPNQLVYHPKIVEPNKSMQPTPADVTDRAYARSAPSTSVADLGRWAKL